MIWLNGPILLTDELIFVKRWFWAINRCIRRNKKELIDDFDEEILNDQGKKIQEIDDIDELMSFINSNKGLKEQIPKVKKNKTKKKK
jgi:hypothetical protein